MGKNYFRIDDRLIHGQIVTGWKTFYNIDEIIAIDDDLYNNPVLQQIMLFGVSGICKAQIVSRNGAKDLLKMYNKNNRLFITRFASDLQYFIDELKFCESVVIGNAAKQKDSKYNFSTKGGGIFFASDNDVALFDDIENKGIKLIYQTVPNYPHKTWSEIKKTHL